MIQLLVGVPEDQRIPDLPQSVQTALQNGRVRSHTGAFMPGAPKIVGGYRLVHLIADYTAQQINDFLTAHPELDWQIGYAADLFPRESDNAIKVWQTPHPQLVNYLADIVEYDENGNPISTTPPTEYTPPHAWAIRGAYWGVLPDTAVPDPESPYWT